MRVGSGGRNRLRSTDLRAELLRQRLAIRPEREELQLGALWELARWDLPPRRERTLEWLKGRSITAAGRLHGLLERLSGRRLSPAPQLAELDGLLAIVAERATWAAEQLLVLAEKGLWTFRLRRYFGEDWGDVVAAVRTQLLERLRTRQRGRIRAVGIWTWLWGRCMQALAARLKENRKLEQHQVNFEALEHGREQSMAANRSEEIALLKHRIQQADPLVGSVLDLYFHDGLEWKEIAQQLGMNAATLRGRVFQVFRRLGADQRLRRDTLGEEASS